MKIIFHTGIEKALMVEKESHQFGKLEKGEKDMTKQETWDKLVKLKVVSGDMPSGLWNLIGINLEKTDLSGANLKGTNLRSANLREANLSNTNLSYTDLSNADLSNTNLSYTDLSHAYLSNTNLGNADLVEANLSYTDLTNANLRGANLTNANLSKTDLQGVDLKGANLTGACIDYSCWPLSCGSLNVVVDERTLKQIGYHWMSLIPIDKIKKLGLEKAVEFVNEFHQVEKGDCPKIKIGE